jgi:hypothetical protein
MFLVFIPLGISAATLAYTYVVSKKIKEDIAVLDGTLEGLIDALYQERIDGMFKFITEELDD